jgi:hypothetical protein
LTTIDYFDRLLGLIKNLARHKNPLLGEVLTGIRALADYPS